MNQPCEAMAALERVRDRVHGHGSHVTFPERCIPDEIAAIVDVLREFDGRLRAMEHASQEAPDGG